MKHILSASLRRLTAGIAGLLALAACTAVPGPSLSSATQSGAQPLSEPISPQQAAEDWRLVLQTHVDGQGRIDFAGIAADPGVLERYVAYVYEVGPNNHPQLFASADDILAYYINAYNALAMYGVLQAGIPERIGGGLKLVDFFVTPHFKLGSQPINLFDLERRVIIPLGEPRAHFALNCMVRDCPRLPREPFTGNALQSQLERETRAFFNEPRNVRLEGDTVILNEILSFYREEFEADAGSLVAYVNRFRDTPLSPESTVDFKDYDWTVNRQP